MKPQSLYQLTLPCILALLSPATADQKLLGCFSTPGSLTNHGTDIFQSIDMCQDTCTTARATYAALHNGNECWCGDSQPSQADLVSSNECSTECPGYPVENCGGSAAWAVYGATRFGIFTIDSSTTSSTDETGVVTLPTVPATSDTSGTATTTRGTTAGGILTHPLLPPTPTSTSGTTTATGSGSSTSETSSSTTETQTGTGTSTASSHGVSPTVSTGSANRGPRILFF